MIDPPAPRRIRVAVVFGGRSAEHAISCVSAGNVLRALDPQRYEAVPIGITPDGRWVRADPDPDRWQILDGRLPEITDGTPVMLGGAPGAGAVQVAVAPVDVVFPVLHGRYGEDGTIQGLLEMAGVPYVGAGVLASAAGMDKEFTKTILGAAGLPVGVYAVLRPGAELTAADRGRLGLPVFVKPARAGSSIGITRVSDWADLADALTVARASDAKVIVEAAVVGREIECGVLDGPAGGPPEASVPGEIRVVSGHDWYDFEAKYLDDACEFDVPAVLPAEVTARLQELARRAFVALDCAGLARVDFFLNPAGELVVNEVNTMPGFTRISMFPRMWQASGVGYPELMDRLIRSALDRWAASGADRRAPR